MDQRISLGSIRTFSLKGIKEEIFLKRLFKVEGTAGQNPDQGLNQGECHVLETPLSQVFPMGASKLVFHAKSRRYMFRTVISCCYYISWLKTI
jgi:hypothetical protein